MNAKFALSLAVSAFILALGGLVAVHMRMSAVETSLRERKAAVREAPPRESPTRGTDVIGTDRDLPPPEEPRERSTDEALASKNALEKLDFLIEKQQKAADDAYDTSVEIGSDLHALKREVAGIKATLRQIIQGIRQTGGFPEGIGWGLSPRGKAPDEATLAAYRKAAEEKGVKVEPGRVTVRGFLNMSPNTKMPIEYFVTRYPEASHETLVHVIGPKALEELREDPYKALEGVATALYKGLVAAGFREGEPSHPDPSSDPKQPKWILAKGDPIYLYVRYERGGKTHLARATDWVIEDPEKGNVLPEDCFRFTGSLRGENPDTGDEFLAAEQMGLLVSVWPNPRAIVEISLETSMKNDYSYNFTRIPKPEGEGPLYLELVFSKEPMAPEGEGKGGGD
jgi:hypothetical protein